MTQRKHLERELTKYAAELKRSNEELERFATIASHDLQEPLRMVTSYLGLIEKRYRGKLDADADEFIHFAVDGASRMSALIQSLLTYSRLGARPPQFAAIPLDRALDVALENVKASVVAAGATIEREPLPVVWGDSAQLAQMFQNLLANALKFRAATAPRIRISATRTGASWTIAVADNGIGIAAADHQRIFELFTRLHARDKYEGTGIGLTLVKRIVERHGGAIRVESTLGNGATFFVTLPAAGGGGADR
ncbi:MAG: sensor histidine kinase [Thermoplasmatota archaeon]